MNRIIVLILILPCLISILIPPKVVRASESTLFSDNFDDGNFNGWSVVNGNWTVDNNNLYANQTGANKGGEIAIGGYDWDNYRVEFDVNNNVGVDDSIYFRRSLTGSNAYIFNLRHGTGAFGTPQIILWKQINGIPNFVQSKNNFSLQNNIWYHVKVEANGENIKFWLNDNKIFDYTDPGTIIKKGNFSLTYWTGSFAKAQVRFDNIKVTSLNAVSNTPTPFLDLPWDYQAKGLSFNDAALDMTSYFDHTYPLLSSGLTESNNFLNQITTFENENSTTKNYSTHDGYDYAKIAKVNIGDPVLAAAAGTATYINSCSACGNMIVIDHGNGYQTRYLHLQKDGLIANVPGQKVQVTTHQQIGKVGATGNVSPAGDAGAHIHFGIFQDKNGDGNFDDNVPDGVTDPFGWQSKDPDPWETYSFVLGGQNKTGNKSYYLWKNKLDTLDSTLTSNGGVFSVGRYSTSFPQGVISQNVNLQINSSPNIKASNTLVSIGSTIIAIARDALGNLVTNFQNLYTLSVDFSPFDLSRYKLDTISFYSSPDGVNWIKEPTTVNLNNKTATTQINHMTHFALLAERIDTTPVSTSAILAGDKGQPNWFRSDVNITLNSEDNPGGLGVDYILYKLDQSDWEIYNTPLTIGSEGHHKLEFYSADKDENLENIKSTEFDIDKTIPIVTIDADPKSIWPPNEKMVYVKITGSAQDNHLSTKTFTVEDEYDLIKPTLTDFDQTIQLEARRDGSDEDGRVYIIKVTAEDLAGNKKEEQVQIIVPHDQGKKDENQKQ